MEKGKNPWPCVIMFQYKTSSAEKNKWVFPPCVGWNYHCVWLTTVSVSMAPQPNCSFNPWDKRQEYISTHPPSSPLSYTPGAEPEQHLLGQNPWDSLQAQRSGYAQLVNLCIQLLHANSYRGLPWLECVWELPWTEWAQPSLSRLTLGLN